MDSKYNSLLGNALVVVVGEHRATVYYHLDGLEDGDRPMRSHDNPETLYVKANERGVPLVDTRDADGDMFGPNPPRPAHHPAQVESDDPQAGAVVSPAAFVEWAEKQGAHVEDAWAAPEWESDG